MKAIVQHRYGDPEDVVELAEIGQPRPGQDEVLVRVRAASIHVGDAIITRGLPLVMRPAIGLRSPKHPVLGTDMAGVVEEVGEGVTDVQQGDEVFGWGDGAFAEYLRTPATNALPKPSAFTFEEASALGVSALTGLIAMRDRGQVQAGQRVLVNGASGGVGPFAIQVAKSMGAEVTGVCSTPKVEMVRSIGADHVIDYTAEDFTQGDERYDFILDNVGNHSLSALRRVLTPDGKVQPNSGAHASGRWMGAVGLVAANTVRSLFSSQVLAPFLQVSDPSDLKVVRELAEAGEISPVIDRTYPLDETAKALAYVGQGHAQGTVVITV